MRLAFTLTLRRLLVAHVLLLVTAVGAAGALRTPASEQHTRVASFTVVQAPPGTELPPARADRSRSEPPTVDATAAPLPPPAPAPEPAPAPPPASEAPVRGVPTMPLCEDGDPEVRGQRVLATLPPVWTAIGMPIQFSGPRRGYFGEVRTDTWVLHVYVRPCDAQSDESLRWVLGHELGHAHDVTFLSDTDREEYKRARGIPAETPWFGCSGCPDLATPAGDYAETYGQWLRGSPESRSQLAPAADASALTQLAARFFGSV